MDIELKIAELEAKVTRLEDMQAIQKLMGKYVYWLYTQKYDLIKKYCWAQKAPDISIEASDSGLFKGQEAVMRFFSPDGVVGALGQVKGGFTLHIACDPVIEIAADGQTAKSVWLSPGCATSMWIWGVFLVDYIKEEGEWRMWHSNFNPLFRTKYHKGWQEEPIGGSLRSPLANEPPTRWNPYSKEKTGRELFHHLPDIPEPYDSMR
jgi:hypothetical protein